MNPLLAHITKYTLRRTSGLVINLFKGSPEKLILITNGRTGSNLLVNILRKEKGIWQNGEIFGEFRLRSAPVRNLINWHGADSYLTDSYRRIFTEKFVINKIIYYQIEKEHGDKFGIPDMENISNKIIADKNYKYIHLKRKDKLANIISNRLAKINKQWVGGQYRVDTVFIDPQWAHGILDLYERWEQRYDTEVSADRLHSIYYEDLIANPQKEIDRLFNFIGISSLPVEINSKKQNRKSHKEVIENYEELKEHFSSTKYASLFKE